MKSLSNRGIKASQSVLRVDMEAYFEAVQNLYHPDDNPNGAFPLNMAENKLSWHILKKKIKHISQHQDIPDWVAGYTSGQGAPSFREAIVHFLKENFANVDLSPERLVFSAGATSVVEMTALVLGDVGDVMAFPAPCYPVYKQDIGNIALMERYDIITHHELSSIKNGLILEIDHLEKAKSDIESQGKRFKALVLTTPDNPTGGLFSYEKLSQIADWCMAHQVHLIVNEIYGLSLIDTSHPQIADDYAEKISFVSFLKMIEERKSDYLHWWYSFSKDFGVSGFRVGAAYSHNELFIKAYTNINYSHLVSNHTQWILEEVLKDTEFVKRYLLSNQKALTEAYIVVVNTLRKLDIEYVPSRGSLFVWLDLSEFLAENTPEAEHEFWSVFYQKTGILLTPGEGFGHTKHGLFRMVYPYFSKEDLKVAMKRMENAIIELRTEKQTEQ